MIKLNDDNKDKEISEEAGRESSWFNSKSFFSIIERYDDLIVKITERIASS
jgi:hypothetical protein